jgi:spore coat protein A
LPPSRRNFIQKAAAFGLLSRTHVGLASQMQHDPMAGMSSPIRSGSADNALRMLHSLELTPFVDALPLPSRAEPIAPHKLRIAMREVHAKVHRDLPPTRFWVYTDSVSSVENGPAIAPLIEAHAQQPLDIEWVNQLPHQHFLPIDHSLHGCGRDVPDVRAIVHVHGASVPSKDDGHPDDWFVPGQSLACHYPLEQDSAGLWFHDHAMGLNRLNVYAGLFGMFLLRDKHEASLNLPSGKYELPLVLYDRNFTADGQLFYPTSGDPEHPWVSEFAGDAILINGKVRPYLEVEPRLYRFRLVNAANSRFFRLALSNQQPFHQIGSDQGLLTAPVELTNLTFAPGERLDLLIDFSHAAGQTIHLRNGGFDILQLRVASNQAAKAISVPAKLRVIDRIPESTAVRTRTITLNEYQDKVGNSMEMLLNRKHWHEPVTERPRLNSTEIWEFVNLTEDVHPMHLHLVRFQVLDRRVFDTFAYIMHKEVKFVSPAQPPAANELGWKDVVQCPPGVITRIIVPFEGYTGSYLYHCHILEHEANDMMRPFEVIA